MQERERLDDDSRRAGAASPGDRADEADRRPSQAAGRPARRCVRSARSSASSDRSARSDPSRAASAAVRRGPTVRGWSPADGMPIDSAATQFGDLVTVFPEGHVGVDDSQVVLLRDRTPSCSPSAPSPGRRRWLGRLLEDLHPRRVLGRACSASTTASPTRCASSCARATSRSSIRSTAPDRSAVRRHARSPSLPLDVDDDGFLVARATSTAPSARSPGTRDA